jgi:retron-type reverse transcriptase
MGANFELSELGVPQGGPLSPLLSNVMLNEPDKELERRGHKFVRYADDMVILCKEQTQRGKGDEYACSLY